MCGGSSSYGVIFVRGVPENVTQRVKREGGVQKGELLRDVFYEWPQSDLLELSE